MIPPDVVEHIADVLHRDWCPSAHHNACVERKAHDRRRARLIAEAIDDPAEHASAGWLEIYTAVDAELLQLAEAVRPSLADRIRQLVDASGRVHRVIELESKLQRADDLEHELRRQLESASRRADRLQAEKNASSSTPRLGTPR